MSKEEKAKKAKEFWDYLAPIQARGHGLTEAEIEWLKEDDCYVDPSRCANVAFAL